MPGSSGEKGNPGRRVGSFPLLLGWRNCKHVTEGLCLSLLYVKTTSSETSPDLLWAACILGVPMSLTAVTDYIILSCLETVSQGRD